MEIGTIVPWVSALVTVYFVFAGDAYPRTKAIVAALCLLSFAPTLWFPEWYLAGLLVQIALIVGLLLYFKVRPE